MSHTRRPRGGQQSGSSASVIVYWRLSHARSPFVLLFGGINILICVFTKKGYVKERWGHFKNFFTEHDIRHGENFWNNAARWFLTTLCLLNAGAQAGASSPSSVKLVDTCTDHACDAKIGYAPAGGAAGGSFGTNNLDSQAICSKWMGAPHKFVNHDDTETMLKTLSGQSVSKREDVSHYQNLSHPLPKTTHYDVRCPSRQFAQPEVQGDRSAANLFIPAHIIADCTPVIA